MASFQAKIDWKMTRKREIKNCLSVPFQPDGKYKIPEKEKKHQKIPLWFHFKPKQVGKGREIEKLKFSFRFVLTQRVIENSKKIANNFKKLRNTVMASFQAKIGRKRPRKRENKNCISVPLLSDA